MNLLEKQKELHDEGSRLLAKGDIISILEKYGTIEVGGSYAYELLSYRDIDLGVISESLTKEKFGEMVGALVTLPSIAKIKTSDRVQYAQRAGGPQGYWIGATYVFEDQTWNFDIWYQKAAWQIDETEKWKELLSELTAEQRTAVLELKEALRAQDKYGVGKQYQSVDVYKTVLDSTQNLVA